MPPAATEVVRVSTRDQLSQALEVRRLVFVVGQGVPTELERDALDPLAVHVLALAAGRPVGTCRLVARDDGIGVLGRLAVLEDSRRRGTGARLVREVETAGRELGLTCVELQAQTHAVSLYLGLGYAVRGGEFVEAGIAHVTMAHELT